MKAVTLLCLLVCMAGACPAGQRLPVGPGDFSSVLPSGAPDQPVHVARFNLDRRPVTNAEFLAFVIGHPQWRRDRIATLFAEDDYLSHWAGADRLGESAQADQPVTRVSWFAARAYCAAAGARLPGWHEWEFAAAADERQADARRDPAWQARILDWYAQPASHALARVGLRPANFYGIQDLHGLVWEWVEDFNALTVSGDSRDQGDPDKLKFCGAGALSLQDKEGYAILMRIAFLSALEARSTARSLGFRCATGGEHQ
ncbi:MAG: formylglycine-generating enzyme family protein [Steroidobacterales bacterium]